MLGPAASARALLDELDSIRPGLVAREGDARRRGHSLASTSLRTDEKLLLLSHPRSGSSNLYEVLAMHPALRICNEPFNEDRVSWGPGYRDYCARLGDWTSLETVLDEIFRSFDGLKLQSYQLPARWVVQLVGRPDFRTLFIRRRNVLQAVVSVLIAEQTQLWHRWDTDRPIESYYRDLRPLDCAEVRTRVRDLAEEVERLEAVVEQRAEGRTHSLLYEDLFFSEPAQTRRMVEDIWSFCGVEPIAFDRIDYFLRPERSKLNSSDTYRLLPNALEIEDECGSDATGHLF